MSDPNTFQLGVIRIPADMADAAREYVESRCDDAPPILAMLGLEEAP